MLRIHPKTIVEPDLNHQKNRTGHKIGPKLKVHKNSLLRPKIAEKAYYRTRQNQKLQIDTSLATLFLHLWIFQSSNKVSKIENGETPKRLRGW